MDTSTPIGRAVAGFYLAFEAADDSDRIREAADWLDRQNALLEGRTPPVDNAPESRRKYLALASGIIDVEKIRRRAGRRLRDIDTTAAHTAELLKQCSVGRPSDIDGAVDGATRHERIVISVTAVQMINSQTRAVLALGEATAAMTVDEWLASHGLTD
ncbi:hypothetical protein [Mycobacterium sp. NPDC050853]|uniref:hypothetical protein n=1 Tax=Mycobacterium sp. NPDC050853 TaxID=3155160 RepID=UPI0033E55CD9